MRAGSCLAEERRWWKGRAGQWATGVRTLCDHGALQTGLCWEEGGCQVGKL